MLWLFLLSYINVSPGLCINDTSNNWRNFIYVPSASILGIHCLQPEGLGSRGIYHHRIPNYQIHMYWVEHVIRIDDHCVALW